MLTITDLLNFLNERGFLEDQELLGGAGKYKVWVQDQSEAKRLSSVSELYIDGEGDLRIVITKRLNKFKEELYPE